ncbi:DNA-directed RNA polymerase subunit omega [bacterium]|nr:DNA-directed RNA polymerase subunit omega [bacterium]
MRPFPIEELVDRVGSRFTVVVAAAKRAKQLKDGAPPLVNLPTRNSLTIALHEIAAGLIQISDAPPEPEEAPEALAAAEPGDLAAPEVVEAALLGLDGADEDEDGAEDEYDSDDDEELADDEEEEEDEAEDEEDEETEEPNEDWEPAGEDG